ncbi:MAG: hypothetical protein HQ546_03025, partial [Planctomycetes bacterium]|nr:hypothetical protein [Planctomycetota bacterium]
MGAILEKSRLDNAGDKGLFLAAFGKHPGWDDHVEDLGMETDRLVAVKRSLYSGGIAGNIDSGAWDALEGAKGLHGYHHEFIWLSEDDLVVGRMWSSRDGKGRTKYPLVVCAHCRNLATEWVLENILPRLEEIEGECRQTTSAEEVTASLDRWR